MTLYNSSIPNLFVDTVTGSRGIHNVLVYLPPDYKTKSYPLVYDFNGSGEDSGPETVLDENGPFPWISATYQPPCVIVCVQGVGWDNQQNTIYTTLKARYNTGNGMTILYGLSEGGWVATAIIGGEDMPGATEPGPNNPMLKDVIALITMSSEANSSEYTPAIAPIVKMGIAVLGSGDPAGDTHASDDQNFINALKAANPNGKYYFVNTPGTGHGGWTTNWNPALKFVNGQDITTWALSLITTTAPPPPPITIKSIVVTNSDSSSETLPPTGKTIKSLVATYTDGSTQTLP
jgi:hypothetical protein